MTYLKIILLLSLIILACEDEGDGTIFPSEVLLACDTPSLKRDELVVANIRASEPFFKHLITEPISSEGSLELYSLTPEDELSATAEIMSSLHTTIGKHRFELQMGDKTGVLTISVLADSAGPGTVKTEGAIATAGARMATLTILGQGTHFDSKCSASVEGADKFTIESVRAVTQEKLEVIYSITPEQPPGEATIVLVDGIDQYELPFTILSTPVFDNQAANQTLVRGQKGWIRLTHPDAGLHFGTFFDVQQQTVETGRTEVISDNEVRIPVRVPYDFPGATLSLVAKSYTLQGAFLELMNTEVRLVEPGYFALTPSRIDTKLSTASAEIVASGLDLTALENLEVNSQQDDLTIASWNALEPSRGTAEFVLASTAEEGSRRITARDGHREYTSVVALVDPGGEMVHRAFTEILQGDRVFLPLVVQGTDLVEGAAGLDGTEDLTVLGLTLIDEGCLIAEVEAKKDAEPGMRTLTLNTGSETYDIRIKIVSSGF